MSSRRSAVITTVVVLAFCIAAGWRIHARQRANEQPVLVLAPSRPAPPAPATSAAVEPARVFADLFGLEASEGGAATGPDELTTIWHRQSFQLGGQPALAVFTQTQELDVETRKPVDSHAQAPRISGVAYQLVEGQWKLAGATRDFARIGAWGEAPRVDGAAQVMAFPGGAVAFLVEDGGSGQGYTHVGRAVWVFERGEWRDLGFVETGGDNEGAALDENRKYSFSGTVSMAPGTRSYPDLLVKREGTMSDEQDRIVAAHDARYVFTGRSYEEALPRR